jgi:UTP:GlnB (protein PII) uridylyltransferase
VFRSAIQRVDEYDAALEVIRAGRPSDISAARLTSFLSGVSHAYLAIFGFASVYEHVRLLRDLGRRRKVDVRLESHDGAWRLIIASVGRRPQVSVVCSVVARFGVTLQRGRFIGTGDDLVLDVFDLADDEGVLASVATAPTELRQLLRQKLTR